MCIRDSFECGLTQLCLYWIELNDSLEAMKEAYKFFWPLHNFLATQKAVKNASKRLVSNVTAPQEASRAASYWHHSIVLIPSTNGKSMIRPLSYVNAAIPALRLPGEKWDWLILIARGAGCNLHAACPLCDPTWLTFYASNWFGMALSGQPAPALWSSETTCLIEACEGHPTF